MNAAFDTPNLGFFTVALNSKVVGVAFGSFIVQLDCGTQDSSTQCIYRSGDVITAH